MNNLEQGFGIRLMIQVEDFRVDILQGCGGWSVIVWCGGKSSGVLTCMDL